MPTTRRPIATILAGLILLAACGPTPTATPVPTVTPTPTLAPAPSPTPTVGVVPQSVGGPAAGAHIRVVQAAPQSGALDIYLEQALVASRLGHGAYTNPTSVAAGVYYLQAVPAGARPSTQVLADTTATLEPEGSYLILVSGTAETLNFAIFQEDLSPIPTGQARLAYLHAVPRGVPVQPRVDGQPYPEVLDFGQVSAGYPVDAGPRQLSVTSGETTIATLGATLAPQQMYTAVLIGQVGGGNETILLFSTPARTIGQVRFIHAAPNTPAATVYLDDQLLAEAVSFRAATGWQDFAPRAYTVRTEIADAEGGLPIETRFNLGANQAVEVLLLEDRGTPALRVYAHSTAPTPPQTARLVVVNAAPSAPAVYAYNRADRLPEIPMIPAGAATQVLDIPASRFELLWLNSQGADARIVERAGEVTFLEGYTYTYVVTGAERDPFVIATEAGVDRAQPAPFVEETPAASEAEGVPVRVFSALTEPLNIRVRLDGITVAEDLAPRQASDQTHVPPAVYTLRVDPVTDPNAPAYYVGELSLVDVPPVTLLVYGNPDAPATALLPDYQGTAQPGQAVLRVIHAAADTGDLLVSFDIPGLAPPGSPTIAAPAVVPRPTLTPGPLEQYDSGLFGPGQTTEFIGLPASTYDIYIRRATDDQVVAIVPRLVLQSRTAYDLFLLPGPSPEVLDVILLPSSLEG
ncbi:MAG: DUF4397 domain-containing protein [Anaerolineae bacterium]|nr:DUF4397 domain-containing protein [Anaerolineae bacterium]